MGVHLGVWPPDDSQQYWAWWEAVYAVDSGIYRAFINHNGRTRRCRHILAESEKLPFVQCVPLRLHGEAPLLSNAEVSELKSMHEVLNKKMGGGERQKLEV